MMRALITDLGGVWELDRATEEKRCLWQASSHPCCPCAGAGLIAFACQQARECVCLKGGREISRMPCVPGVSEMLLSPCGRYIYQLSSEADCIHTRLVETGELLFAAPVGVFPRMMTLDGQYLLAAGGAVPKAYVLTAPELQLERVISLPHPCFAVSPCREGLVLVCAAEGEDIRTAVYGLSRLQTRFVCDLPGQPGGLCVTEDSQHAMLSTREGLMHVSLRTGKVLWNRPEWALSMRIRCRDGWALVSDTLGGGAALIQIRRPGERLWQMEGENAQACFL